MKAVILAGGEGTRLYPLTHSTNKHLLTIYNKPVIYHAIEKLTEAGIDKIMIVTSPRHIEQFVHLLGAGERFTLNNRSVSIVYAIQDAPRGIAHALHIAKDFIGNENSILWLGDGIIEDDINAHIKNFKKGARIFLKKVSDPERFGVATVDKHMRVTGIVEKPKKPKSDLAVVGLYIYDNTVFQKMKGQKASARGEYEITDINNKYLAEGNLDAVLLKKEWFDIGTFESLYAASTHMRNKELSKKKKK